MAPGRSAGVAMGYACATSDVRLVGTSGSGNVGDL